ncbi:DUF6493 family protein [Dactylosporangium sp. CA-233914]|uniref:DUF6493 family protein n=1 Tax=Dactylosporangium sp. CA-233914 TaxID=3239934 RepID=UPI003D8BC0E5
MTGLDLALVADGKVNDVAAAVAALDEPGRRAAAKELAAFVKGRRHHHWHYAGATALAVATIGTAPSPAAAAAILKNRWMTPARDTAAAMVATAAGRGVTWLPELVTRLTDRRPTDPDDRLWQLAAELLTATGTPPPTGDWFVLGWLGHLNFPVEQRERSRPLAERLRRDPFLDDLLPHLFTVEGAGERLVFWETGRPGGKLALIEALAELAGESRLDRAALIAATLSRLLRGGRPNAQRGYLTLLTALAPRPDEVSGHAGDYLRLLSDAPVSVATAAQRSLRTAPDLELEAILEASAAVLRRPDKALVRAQLAWLDALTRRHPARTAGIAAVIAEATTHEAVDIRDRATALLAKHGAPVAAAAAPPAAVALPPRTPVAPAPAPIEDADELAEEVAAFYSDRPFSALLPMERILDAVVRLTASDGAALRAALLPVLNRHREGMADHGWDPCCLCGTFTGVLLTATDPEHAPRQLSGWAALLTAARRFLALGEPTPDPRVPAIHRLLRARLAEIGHHLRTGAGSRAGLVSAPTWASGALDTAVLLDRLAGLGDLEPWAWDLTQALLRLPPGPDEPAAARAEALGTPAGALVAAWLRGGGLPAPAWQVETVARRPRKHRGDYEHDTLPPVRVQVTTAPVEPPGAAHGLLGATPPPPGPGSGGWHVLWPGLLPWHRGLAAAFALPDVAATADMDQRGGAAVLPLLAETAGDPGPALPIAVAYALAARHEQDRLAAVDALLLLTADDSFAPETAGHHLGTLAATGAITLTRTLHPLRDAATAGAPHTVFRLLTAALPPLLKAKTPPRGTPDLLTLATETAPSIPAATTPPRTTVTPTAPTSTTPAATTLAPTAPQTLAPQSFPPDTTAPQMLTPTAQPTTAPTVTDIPGLAELAARCGSSRLITEARRLANTLTPTT